ncbi:unnamed protein product, partial [Iphiclides podalirius]
MQYQRVTWTVRGRDGGAGDGWCTARGAASFPFIRCLLTMRRAAVRGRGGGRVPRAAVGRARPRPAHAASAPALHRPARAPVHVAPAPTPAPTPQ